MLSLHQISNQDLVTLLRRDNQALSQALSDANKRITAIRDLANQIKDANSQIVNIPRLSTKPGGQYSGDEIRDLVSSFSKFAPQVAAITAKTEAILSPDNTPADIPQSSVNYGDLKNELGYRDRYRSDAEKNLQPLLNTREQDVQEAKPELWARIIQPAQEAVKQLLAV